VAEPTHPREARASKLFDNNSPGCAEYIACRDHVTKESTRAALEGAWHRVGHLCPEAPEQFVKEFRRDFYARAWELFLLFVLDGAGLTLERTASKGPDICVRLASGKRCWIEAVVPTPGSGDDAIPPLPQDPSRVRAPPMDKLLLRYRSVLHDKMKKLAGYRSDGIVGDQDVVLVAINQGAIENSDLNDQEVPALLKAVLPIGEPLLVVPIDSVEKPHVITPRREAVKKANDEPVSTTFFLEPATAFISGILFATDIWNLRWTMEESLSLIHRPGAAIPLPPGELQTRCELWVDEEGFLKHRGRCGRFGHYAE
jgi:hypothetical protein